MKLLQIEDKSLELLLEKKREYIGNNKFSPINLISGIVLIISAFSSEFNIRMIPSEVLKAALVFLGIIEIWLELRILHKEKQSPYGKDALLMDIKKLDHVVKRYSIIAVHDSFNEHSRKFLLYYDKGWDCKFFLNYPTSEDGTNDRVNIIKHLANDLGIAEKDIDVVFKGAQQHEKYSTEHDEWRTYKHSIYEANITQFPRIEKNKTFKIDGKVYFWMTLDEMLDDDRIKAHNSDVVNLVKTYV